MKARKHGHARKGSKSPEYVVWVGIRQRCRKGYAEFDPVWDDFARFLEDMGQRPSDEHSIERIDNSLGYTPSNCRWATGGEQNRNTRRTRYYTYQDETMCMADWADRFGIKRGTLRQRLGFGMSIAEALTEPLRKNLLDDATVRAIRSAKGGVRIIAQRFGVSKSLVSMIRRGELYSSVE